MDIFLFALPLVGGLFFCSTWNCTRYRVAREEGHRHYFRAVFFGTLLLLRVAYVQFQLLAYWPGYAAAEADVKHAMMPMAKEPTAAMAVADLSVTCLWAMVACWPLAWILNLRFRNDPWLRRAIKNDDFEAL